MQDEDDLRALAKVMDFMRAISILFVIINVYKDFNRDYNIIYVSVLAAIIAAIVSMFFIKIDIVVTAGGIIKAEGENKAITVPANGRLSIVKLEENSVVNKGDTLFIIRPDNIMAQIPSLERRRSELTEFIHDIEQLTNTKFRKRPNLRSAVYSHE